MHTPSYKFRIRCMPISRRPVESINKRRGSDTSTERSGRHPPKAAPVVIRAAVVLEETGSAFHTRGGVIHCHIHSHIHCHRHIRYGRSTLVTHLHWISSCISPTQAADRTERVANSRSKCIIPFFPYATCLQRHVAPPLYRFRNLDLTPLDMLPGKYHNTRHLTQIV